MKNKKEIFNIVISVFLFVFAFILVSFLVQENINYLKNVVASKSLIFSAVIYVFIGFLATVVAPVSSLPLVPVASYIFGWKVTGLLNILGWGFGSVVSFYIARKYGKRVVRKFVSLRKIEIFEDRLSKDNIFWLVVFFRIIVPVDVLSYALGFFTRIKTKDYMLATILGIAPFSFILAYMGTLKPKEQFIYFIFFFFIFIIAFFVKSIITKQRG